MSDTTINSNINLTNIGGSWQFSVNSPNDFANVLKLDPAHWAMTAVRADILRCTPDFLNLMKSPETGRIRIEAVRNLLTWMLDNLSDLQGAIPGTDELRIAQINQQTSDGSGIASTMAEILSVLKLTQEDFLNFQRIKEYKANIAASNLNGDSVIPPECVSQEELAAFIRLVMSVSGSKADASGKPGISPAELESYVKTATDYLAWREKGNADASLLCFGKDTQKLLELYIAAKPDIDSFFQSCHAFVYAGAGQAEAIHNTFDPLDQNTYGTFFDKAPIAPANAQFILSIADENNPVKVAPVAKFLTAFREAEQGDSKRISLAEWNAFRNKIAPYAAWIAAKNTDKLDAVSTEDIIASLAPDKSDSLRKLFTADAAVAAHLANTDLIYKLMLCQKNMRLFLNNFIGMQALFSANEPSLLLAGTLVMDGRNFELTMPVSDISAHKTIAQNSNICTLYLEVSSGTGAALSKMTITAAVTSGNMRSLFVGKTGLFYTVDGKIMDAKIIDILRQPVSLPEVLLLPFTKLAEIFKKQTDKYISSKSKEYETKVSSATDSPEALKNNSSNMSMLLMGGGIGIAALGSSFAFIVSTLKDVSLSTIIYVLIGILFIFGAPFIIPGLIKLFTRSLTLFLEADGCSMNRKMRMSIPLGNYFTYIPDLPEGSRRTVSFTPVPYRNNSHMSDRGINKRMIIVIIAILLIAAIVYGYRASKAPVSEQTPSQEQTPTEEQVTSEEQA